MITFRGPDLTELKARIVVVGVGGAGGNAINNMIESELEGVEFIAANTDSQVLSRSAANKRIQLGVIATEGLGAGARPDIGQQAAIEALDEIKAHLSGAHMVFIAAGMGGGTGTGAAPVIAEIARDMGALTVAVVTKPFAFEGRKRAVIADKGIELLRDRVDALLVIPNQNLFLIANPDTTFQEAFRMADEVLYSGVACITDLIVKNGLVNLDFADVRTVMRGMGTAMMGTATAGGDNRAETAAREAICNPLLEAVALRGARGLLISIAGGQDLKLSEIDLAVSLITNEVDEQAEIIFGAITDHSLDGKIRVSVVASGFDKPLSHGQSGGDRGGGRGGADPRSMAGGREAMGEGLNQRLNHRSGGGGADYGAGQTAPARGYYDPAAYPSTASEGLAHGTAVVEPIPATEPHERQDAPEPWLAENGARVMRSRPELMEGPLMGGGRPGDGLGHSQDWQPQWAQTGHTGAPARGPNRGSARIIDVDELPATARRQVQLRAGEKPDLGIEAHKRRAGWFERLTGMGVRRVDDEPATRPVAQGQQKSRENSDTLRTAGSVQDRRDPSFAENTAWSEPDASGRQTGAQSEINVTSQDVRKTANGA